MKAAPQQACANGTQYAPAGRPICPGHAGAICLPILL